MAGHRNGGATVDGHRPQQPGALYCVKVRQRTGDILMSNGLDCLQGLAATLGHRLRLCCQRSCGPATPPGQQKKDGWTGSSFGQSVRVPFPVPGASSSTVSVSRGRRAGHVYNRRQGIPVLLEAGMSPARTNGSRRRGIPGRHDRRGPRGRRSGLARRGWNLRAPSRRAGPHQIPGVGRREELSPVMTTPTNTILPGRYAPRVGGGTSRSLPQDTPTPPPRRDDPPEGGSRRMTLGAWLGPRQCASVPSLLELRKERGWQTPCVGLRVPLKSWNVRTPSERGDHPVHSWAEDQSMIKGRNLNTLVKGLGRRTHSGEGPRAAPRAAPGRAVGCRRPMSRRACRAADKGRRVM